MSELNFGQGTRCEQIPQGQNLFTSWITPIGCGLFLILTYGSLGIFETPEEVVQDSTRMLSGLFLTLGFAVFSALCGLLVGAVLGTLRSENPWGLGYWAAAYIEFFRSIPLILLLFFMHYGFLPLLGVHPDILVSSLFSFCLFESAYFAEIIRGGIRSIHRTEREAAIGLGLSPFQQFRFVIWPLAFQRSVPALVNQLIALLKDTSLASIVGVIEFT
ncbi:MAG: amino acid ABC transporter permease, partial [Cyanobacteria bacterium]|nr:amino acid ABC transporter permease [Cyanobacteriota bacterium]